MCLRLGNGHRSRHHEESGDENDDGAELPELHIVILRCGPLQRVGRSSLSHLRTYSRGTSASSWGEGQCTHNYPCQCSNRSHRSDDETWLIDFSLFPQRVRRAKCSYEESRGAGGIIADRDTEGLVPCLLALNFASAYRCMLAAIRDTSIHGCILRAHWEWTTPVRECADEHWATLFGGAYGHARQASR